MKIKIEVTQDDINRGTPRCTSACPIARAIQRLLSKDSEAFVGGSVITIIKDHDSASYSLPKKAEKFIRRFDHYLKEDLKPFSFTLDVKSSYLKKSAR